MSRDKKWNTTVHYTDGSSEQHEGVSDEESRELEEKFKEPGVAYTEAKQAR